MKLLITLIVHVNKPRNRSIITLPPAHCSSAGFFPGLRLAPQWRPGVAETELQCKGRQETYIHVTDIYQN
jgi:hypothetical protein